MIYDSKGNAFPGAEVFDLTLALDTVAYTSGDVLFVPVEVKNFFPGANMGRALQSLQILDEDAQGAAFDLLFLVQSEDIGTINGAIAITDTEARSISATHKILSTDWTDWTAWKLYEAASIGKVLRGVTTSLWVAGVARGTPTHTATGLKLRIGAL